MLDTNVVSALMRDPQGQVRQRLEVFGEDDVCMSIISACELRFGAEKKNSARIRQRLEVIMGAIPITPLEQPVEIAYGRVRAGLAAIGRIVGPNDLLIAAHALSLGLILVTANMREFARVPGLVVDNWLD